MSNLGKRDKLTKSNTPIKKRKHNNYIELDEDLILQNPVPLIDKLNILLKGCNIILPKIVIIGDQSSGKSSLLEGLIGIKDIFPQGYGLVTGRKIRLQLINTPSCTEPEYYFQSSSSNTKKKLFKHELTEEIKKNNKCKFKGDIIITIKSSSVATLTLVDTPGIVEIIDDNANDPLINRFKDIVKNEIKDKNTIIIFLQKLLMKKILVLHILF